MSLKSLNINIVHIKYTNDEKKMQKNIQAQDNLCSVFLIEMLLGEGALRCNGWHCGRRLYWARRWK